jgi:DNA-binding CsgD family transcriptional regulator
MVTVDDFSRLVSGIYAAAVTEDWKTAIGGIQRTLGGTNGALLLADKAGRSHLDSVLPVEAATSYEEHYNRLDQVLAAVEKGPVAAVRTGTELIAPERNTEFYAGWVRPFELEDGLLVRLTGGPKPTCFIVAAPKRTESFDTPERVKLMSGLVVHLQQALRTRDKLAALDGRSVDLAAALEVVRHGVLIVSFGCAVIDLNSAAERMLRADDGVQIRSGRIAATSSPADRKLYRAIHLALIDDGQHIRSGHWFTCGRPSGKRPYVIHVLPLHRAGIDEVLRQETALVVIIDLDHEPRSAAMILRRLYGLTNAEAEVALRIAQGVDLKQIAEELSVTFTTVRTHLQHVFDKTDTHRQPELVRLLLTLNP